MKKTVIGILAHVDAGKTTLSEALLYTAGQLKKLGRVDNKSAFLDNYELERRRGITIFSKQAVLRTENTEITLLDTPGHIDFSSEAERTLQVQDYAVLVISARDGVQPQSETVWRQADKYNVPRIGYVNKMDLSQAEAVADLIASTNKATHQMALSQLKGHFSSELTLLREKLLSVMTGLGSTVSSTSTISSLLKNYNGLKLGWTMKK